MFFHTFGTLAPALLSRPPPPPSNPISWNTRHLLPASTGGDGSSRSNAINAVGGSGRGAAAATADRSNSSGGRGTSGAANFSSVVGDLWASVVSASGRLGRAAAGGSGSGRWGRRVAAGAGAGAGAPSDSSAPSARVQQGPDLRGAASNGGGGDSGTGGWFLNAGGLGDDDDEEMGRRRAGSGATSDAAAASGGGVDIGDDDAAGARRAGGGSGPVGSRSWVASLGLRKSSVLNGAGGGASGGANRVDEAGITAGRILGMNGGNNGRGGRGVGGTGAGVPGARMGLCGKRTVPRALSAGGNRVFETLPGESYFRGRPQSGAWAAGAGSANHVSGGDVGGASLSVAATAATAALGGRGGGGGDRETTAGSRRWPRVGDSVRAGRCSLAIVIRPAAGAESGDWSGWRHRPTHRVTRQVSEQGHGG